MGVRSLQLKCVEHLGEEREESCNEASYICDKMNSMTTTNASCSQLVSIKLLLVANINASRG